MTEPTLLLSVSILTEKEMVMVLMVYKIRTFVFSVSSQYF